MSDFLVFVYGLIGVFVLSGMNRNVNEQRPHSRTLTMVGWSMMSASATLGTLLALYALYLLAAPLS